MSKLQYINSKILNVWNVRRYAYSAELAGIGYSLANTKSGITLAVKGYSDKQQVLLHKIMDKLTKFTVDPNRFTILKELYARGLKNFQVCSKSLKNNLMNWSCWQSHERFGNS